METTPIRLQSKYLNLYQNIDNIALGEWKRLPGTFSHRDLASVRTMLYRMAKAGAWKDCKSIQTRAYEILDDKYQLTIMKVTK